MEKNISGIVRFGEVDLNGNLPLDRCLMRVKGIGYSLTSIVADIIYEKLGIEKGTPVGAFTNEQLKKAEEIIRDLDKYLPNYLLNARFDTETGENRHIIGSKLMLKRRQDIERKKRIRSWQGLRHMFGKRKVRGQRTKNTGRHGIAMGVSKKKGKK